MNEAMKPKKRAAESTLLRRHELCQAYLSLPKAQRKPGDFAAKNGVNTNTFKGWVKKYKKQQESPNATAAQPTKTGQKRVRVRRYLQLERLLVLSNLEHPEAYLADAARELPPRLGEVCARAGDSGARTVSVSVSLAQSRCTGGLECPPACA